MDNRAFVGEPDQNFEAFIKRAASLVAKGQWLLLGNQVFVVDYRLVTIRVSSTYNLFSPQKIENLSAGSGLEPFRLATRVQN